MSLHIEVDFFKPASAPGISVASDKVSSIDVDLVLMKPCLNETRQNLSYSIHGASWRKHFIALCTNKIHSGLGAILSMQIVEIDSQLWSTVR